MGRVGRLMMLIGFLGLWFVPVAGCLIMVAGAISTAIAFEAGLPDAPPAGDAVAGVNREPDSAVAPVV